MNIEEIKEHPLRMIEIRTSLFDSHSVTNITQEYKNCSDKSQEIDLNFLINEESVLSSLTVSVEDKILKSKIYEKEKAKEKYSDSIASGNTAILGETGSNDSLTLNIGNLLPGKTMKIIFELITGIKCEDLSYEFTFPLMLIPQVVINKQSRAEIKYTKVDFSAKYSSPSKITRFVCPSHTSNTTLSEDIKSASLSILEIQLQNSSSSIQILFKNEDLNLPRVYSEYSTENNQYAYKVQYKLDSRNYQNSSPDLDKSKKYEKLFDDLNDTPSTFIFLIDQSGSMDGQPIETAKEALKLFIKSLPQGCEYSVVGFGSEYKAYTGVLQYTKDNIKNTMKLIESLSADLGGTNIHSPLNYLFNLKEYNPTFCRNVFLLTDGCVSDSSSCIRLIKENNDKFRVHALGIGSGVSQDFITKCGEAGRGSAEFAVELRDIAKKVIKALNCALKFYYSNFLIKLSSDVDKVLEYPKLTKEVVLYQDELFTYSFITKEKLDESTLISVTANNVQNGTKLSKELTIKDCLFDIGESNVLTKYIAGSILKKYKELSLSDQEVIRISKDYGVLSSLTSLFLEVENFDSNQSEEIEKVSIQAVAKGKVTHKEENYTSSPLLNFSAMRCNQKMILNSACSSTKKRSFNKYAKESEKSTNIIVNCIQAPINLELKHYEEESLEMDRLSPPSMECSIIDKFSSPVNMISNDCKEKEKKKVKQSGYMDITDYQQIDGRWSDTNYTGLIQTIISQYKSKLEELTSKILNKDIAITILLTWYLFTFFPGSKDEYFVITNKARKFIMQNGLKYEDYSNYFN